MWSENSGEPLGKFVRGFFTHRGRRIGVEDGVTLGTRLRSRTERLAPGRRRSLYLNPGVFSSLSDNGRNGRSYLTSLRRKWCWWTDTCRDPPSVPCQMSGWVHLCSLTRNRRVCGTGMTYAGIGTGEDHSPRDPMLTEDERYTVM